MITSDRFCSAIVVSVGRQIPVASYSAIFLESACLPWFYPAFRPTFLMSHRTFGPPAGVEEEPSMDLITDAPSEPLVSGFSLSDRQQTPSELYFPSISLHCTKSNPWYPLFPFIHSGPALLVEPLVVQLIMIYVFSGVYIKKIHLGVKLLGDR